MINQKPHGESKSLDDAVCLAMAMVQDGNAETIEINALAHAAEIAQYDKHHASVEVLRELHRWAVQFRISLVRAETLMGDST